MINKFHYRQSRFTVLSSLSAIAFLISLFLSPGATAKLFDGPVDNLPLEQRVSLRNGEVSFLGENGTYTCRILVDSTMENAWAVLTDYDNFAEFLPGVESSQIVEIKGDRKIFEQTNKIKTLIFSIKSRIKISTTESYPEQILFKAIDGDLETLNGEWRLEPVSEYPSAPPSKVLMTHQVTVEPAKAPSDGVFFNIYESRLKETIAAIKQETEKRSGNTQVLNPVNSRVN